MLEAEKTMNVFKRYLQKPFLAVSDSNFSFGSYLLWIYISLFRWHHAIRFVLTVASLWIGMGNTRIFFLFFCYMFYKRLVPFYIPESITTDYFHEALSAAESISNKPDLISHWLLEISCGQRQSKLLNRLMQVTAVKKPAWSQVKLFKLPVLHETSSIIQITFFSLSHKVLKFSKKSFSHFLVAKITELD